MHACFAHTYTHNSFIYSLLLPCPGSCLTVPSTLVPTSLPTTPHHTQHAPSLTFNIFKSHLSRQLPHSPLHLGAHIFAHHTITPSKRSLTFNILKSHLAWQLPHCPLHLGAHIFAHHSQHTRTSLSAKISTSSDFLILRCSPGQAAASQSPPPWCPHLCPPQPARAQSPSHAAQIGRAHV